MKNRVARWVMLILAVLWISTALTRPAEAAARSRRHTGASSRSHSRSTGSARRSGRGSYRSGRVRRRRVAHVHTPSSHLSRLHHVRLIRSPWSEPTFADSTAGDSVDGEDLTVRRAAVQALGPYNGSVVVVDPASGRILSIVNQKLAYKSGFQPCSTIKLVAALAGLSEGVIDRETLLHAGTAHGMTLTHAIAHSNNWYFSKVGERLGLQKISTYARQFGLGEKASDISDEQPGSIPDSVPGDGVGMTTSFGEGFSVTPLELAALVSAIANGGTLYTLQRPRSLQDAAHFEPKIKRHLDIEQWIPEIKPGMMAAVEYGTARRAVFDPGAPVYGKTGTCTDQRSPTHLGWFGSFNEVGNKKVVVVVLLTGGHPVNGPVASSVAGAVYRNLASQNFFGSPIAPFALISTQSCCAGGGSR